MNREEVNFYEKERRVAYNTDEQTKVVYKDVVVVFDTDFFEVNNYIYIPVNIHCGACYDEISYRIEMHDANNNWSLWLQCDTESIFIKMPENENYRACISVTRMFEGSDISSKRNTDIIVDFPRFISLSDQESIKRFRNCASKCRFEYLWKIWNDRWIGYLNDIRDILGEKISKMGNYCYGQNWRELETIFYLCKENDYTVIVDDVMVRIAEIDAEGVLTIVFDNANEPQNSHIDVGFLKAPYEPDILEWFETIVVQDLPTKVRYLDPFSDEDSLYCKFDFVVRDGTKRFVRVMY